MFCQDNSTDEEARKRVQDADIVRIKSEMRYFKSNENIHKKEGGSYYVVSCATGNTDVL